MFTETQLERFYQEGESRLANYGIIKDRLALSITAGIGEYTLPSYVHEIVSITNKGIQLNPFSGQQMIWSGSSPVGVISGDPRDYVYSYKGVGVIRLYPTPNISIAAPTTDLWETAAISTGMIVEFTRSPDFASTTNRVPAAIRDMFLDDYVYYRGYGIESKELDLNASNFFKGMWGNNVSDFEVSLDKITKCVVHGMSAIINEYNRKPPRPVLPSNFGRKVY